MLWTWPSLASFMNAEYSMWARGVAVLVVLQVVGLNAYAWKQGQALAARHADSFMR